MSTEMSLGHAAHMLRQATRAHTAQREENRAVRSFMPALPHQHVGVIARDPSLLAWQYIQRFSSTVSNLLAALASRAGSRLATPCSAMPWEESFQEALLDPNRNCTVSENELHVVVVSLVGKAGR
jgi:hypothetical protein